MTREEAIKILDEVIPPPEHHTVDLDHLRIAQAWRCIKETLTAEPKHGHWTPITEAEPPLGTHVLVTYKHGEDDYETSELDYGMSKAQNTWHWRRVIAWQPMPEPYEEVTP